MRLVCGRELRGGEAGLSDGSRPKERWPRWARAGAALLLCGAVSGMFSCGGSHQPASEAAIERLGRPQLAASVAHEASLDGWFCESTRPEIPCSTATEPSATLQETAAFAFPPLYGRIRFGELGYSQREEAMDASAACLRANVISRATPEGQREMILRVMEGAAIANQRIDWYASKTRAVRSLTEIAIAQGAEPALKERLVSFFERNYTTPYMALQLGDIGAAEGIGPSLRMRIVEIQGSHIGMLEEGGFSEGMFGWTYGDAALISLGTIGSSAFVELDVRSRIAALLASVLGEGGRDAVLAAEQLASMVSAEGVDPAERERAFERIFSVLPQGPQDEGWYDYTRYLAAISLLEGVGPQYRERAIGLLESASGLVEQDGEFDYENPAAELLRETALSERCDPATRQRIVSFMERASSQGDAAMRASMIGELAEIASNGSTEALVRERIAGLIAACARDAEPIVRSHAVFALSRAEFSINRDEVSDPALRALAVRIISNGLRDGNMDVYETAGLEAFFFMNHRPDVSREDLDMLVPAIIGSPVLRDEHFTRADQVLGIIPIDLLSPRASSILAGYYLGQLREGTALDRTEAARALGSICSSGTSQSLRRRIITHLREAQHDSELDVREAASAAIGRGEEAESP